MAWVQLWCKMAILYCSLCIKSNDACWNPICSSNNKNCGTVWIEWPQVTIVHLPKATTSSALMPTAFAPKVAKVQSASPLQERAANVFGWYTQRSISVRRHCLQLSNKLEVVDDKERLSVSKKWWQQISHASVDSSIQQWLRATILQGLPESKSDLPECLYSYFDLCDTLLV